MNNIVLIGMPASGKSTLGVILAKILGKEFADTDLFIQKSQGRLLQNIINEEGLDRFVKIEEDIILKSTFTNCVISTGGSAVYSVKAMKFLKESGKVVYLHAAYEEIEKRLKNITTRGIVMRKGSALKDVYDERVPLYMKYADITIDCTGSNIEQCVNAITEKIKGG
jgi:shikimate kinase